ncbi:hypothetical protein EJB05_52790, partial [Eragrostis curvula]
MDPVHRPVDSSLNPFGNYRYALAYAGFEEEPEDSKEIQKTQASRASFDEGLEDIDPDIRKEAEKLHLEEQTLDEHISEIREKLKQLTEDESNQRWLYLTEDDIKGLHCFQNQILIAIKAPYGTSVEVPDPDVKAGNYYQRRYRIIVRSTMGPIDVYLVSKFEEKSEAQQGGVATPTRKTNSAKHVAVKASRTIEAGERSSTKEVLLNARRFQKTTDPKASYDFQAAMMKINPSDVDSDADYWLLTDDDLATTGVSATVGGNLIGDAALCAA